MITVNIETCLTTGLDVAFLNWRIFPNPTDGIFTIVSDKEIISCEIFSVQGGFLMSKQINALQAEIRLNLEAGIYLCKVKNQSGAEFTQRLIVTH
jgi:hypothetical protein